MLQLDNSVNDMVCVREEEDWVPFWTATTVCMAFNGNSRTCSLGLCVWCKAVRTSKLAKGSIVSVLVSLLCHIGKRRRGKVPWCVLDGSGDELGDRVTGVDSYNW